VAEAGDNPSSSSADVPSPGVTAARSLTLVSELAWDGEGRNRTGDTTIFSRVLYQLSYLA
jgi:hypothetical protein